MANTGKLNEEAIGDIILCDPITSSGREALIRLGLTGKEVSPEFFYSNLRIESKYGEGKEYDDVVSNNDRSLYYQYTVDSEQFKASKIRLEEFNARFSSNSPNQYPLLILGVAGNGKSIEINRRVRERTSGRTGGEYGAAYIDLEDAFTQITYGVTYQCPENTSLWLFCIKLLDGIMKYIKHCQSLCSTIRDNFNKIIVKENLANDNQKQLFQAIGDYYNGGNDKETKVFQLLKSFLSSKQPDKDIQVLLEILMVIMYCSAPDQKQYIFFDNIEQYIKLNPQKIQIPNSAITTLYRAVNEVVLNMVNAFDRIEKDLGWKAFKIIIVLRRTSIGLLDSSFLQSPVKERKNITDVTGYYQISEIWENKREHLWDKKLCAIFNDSSNEHIISIVNIIMQDGPQAFGTDYQSIIAPLMSYGIRRNARAQAHAAYETYGTLFNSSPETIKFDEFLELMSAASHSNPIRYMFRRALIEIQFKWTIANENQDRWRNLNIGYLAGKKETNYAGKKFTIERVAYQNPGNVTFMRRILTYLSCFPEGSIPANGQNKLIVDMFATVSLYNLIEGVLYNPSRKNLISKDDYLQFAKVLIALSDMSNEDTRSAPYVILGIADEDFHVSTNELTLATLLEEIYIAGPKESLPDGKYNCRDFGARITDAGHSFLLDWHASYSFMASLHCFTIPSLFFLKDIPSIKYVIDTVYNASTDLCQKYENEAARFCGPGDNFTLKSEMYLPNYKNRYITFRQRMKELHTNHLNLYQTYIEINYQTLKISKNDMQILTEFISKYIAKYNNWKTDKGASECF